MDVRKFLLNHAAGKGGAVNVNDLVALRRGPLRERDADELNSVFNHLVTSNLLVELRFHPEPDTTPSRIRTWQLTNWGRQFLQHLEEDPAPEDREGFLAQLRSDPDLDPFVDATIEEALWAYGRGHPVATVMCLFAAMEQVVIAVDEATQEPRDNAGISARFNGLDDRIRAAGLRKKGKGDARQVPQVQAFLSTTFPAVRGLRNSVAHGADRPDIAQVRVLLLQFLAWYEAAAHLRDNPRC